MQLLKLLIFILLSLGLGFLISLLVFYGKHRTIPRDPTTNRLHIKADPWLFTLVILGVSWGMVHYADHRPLASLGLHFYSSWWMELGLGILWGILMTMTMALLLKILSKGSSSPKVNLGRLATFPAHFRGALGEELLIRGYPFQVLIGFIGANPAVLVTSMVFGLLHYSTQGWIGALDTGLAGVMLATAVLKTKALWLAIGIHLGWNFAEALLSLEKEASRERYWAEIIVILFFWLLLIALPIQPHPEMERLWQEHIVQP